MVWVYVGDGETPHPIDEQLPEELVDNAGVVGRADPAPRGQLALRLRERVRRGPREVPAPHVAVAAVQADAGLEHDQDRRARPVDLPRAAGAVLGRRLPRPRHVVGNRLVQAQAAEGDRATSATPASHRRSTRRSRPRSSPASRRSRMPGVLRIAYPTFIHYEFYVPVDADNQLYVGVMADFKQGLQDAALLREVPRRDALAVPRPVLRPGQVDGRGDRRTAGEALPPRRLAAAVAQARRGRHRGPARAAAPTGPRAHRATENGQDADGVRSCSGVGASHSTLMNTHWDQVVHTDRAEAFRDALAQARRRIARRSPTWPWWSARTTSGASGST